VGLGPSPVLVDEKDTIIAGHGRVMAANKLGLDEIPVMVARGWTDAQRRAYVIADNRLAENAGWDDDLLKVELEELQALNFDLEKTGFTVDQFEQILAGRHEGLTDENDVPAVPMRGVTELGDVWLLGKASAGVRRLNQGGRCCQSFERC
jgi:ParB-like chromosome segregation protein Spo0J